MAGDIATVRGRRLPGGFLRHGDFRPGDYQVVTAGSEHVLGLWVLPPCGGRARHVRAGYIEHGDGTVSIDGALRFEGWEGFLEHGLWRQTPAEPLPALAVDPSPGGMDAPHEAQMPRS
jgi:hypothetical protein